MDYDRQVNRISRQNKPLLNAFRQWLEAADLSAKTVRTHVGNVDFFSEYLVYYEPLESLTEADEADIYSFCADWFPRKAMWASAGSARSNMTSFRKFARFMVAAGYWQPEREQAIRAVLRANRDAFIDIAETYYDQLGDDW